MNKKALAKELVAAAKAIVASSGADSSGRYVPVNKIIQRRQMLVDGANGALTIAAHAVQSEIYQLEYEMPYLLEYIYPSSYTQKMVHEGDLSAPTPEEIAGAKEELEEQKKTIAKLKKMISDIHELRLG